MAALSFADRYRAANLTPNGETIRQRQESFEKLRVNMDIERIVEITRLYFGLKTKELPPWFIEEFVATDLTFSSIDNERELAVLAECLLASALEDGIAAAGLSILSASANGTRRPLVEKSNFVSEARDALRLLSVTGRQVNTVDLKKINPPTKSNIDENIAELTQTPDWNNVAALFKKISDSEISATTQLFYQVDNVLQPMSQRLAQLEEEASMFWWLVGGWSRILDCPFSEIDPALAPGIAGIDLATLTTKPPGPVAVPAILHRLISQIRKSKPSKVSIQDMVDAFPSQNYDQLNLSAVLKDVPDLCPALTGFRLVVEIGESSAWKTAFQKVVGFGADASYFPVELAMQVYRESLLVSLLDG